MSGGIRTICMLGIGFGFFHPASAPAQQEDLGRIERIAEILGGRTAREIRQATPRVQIRHAGSEEWTHAAPGAAVVRNTNVLVQRYVDARVNVQSAAHRGRLVLLPELLRTDGGRAFPAEAGQPVADGSYGLLSRPERADELAVSVDRGALVVDWTYGRLVVIAGGTDIVITGTRVAFSTEPDGETGYLFLEEGSVSFPEHPEVTVAPGEVVRLQRGLPPVIVAVPPVDAQAIRQAVRYHSQQVWASFRPFWMKPVVFLPAAAVVVGGAIIAVIDRDKDPPSEGTVIIRFPPQ